MSTKNPDYMRYEIAKHWRDGMKKVYWVVDVEKGRATVTQTTTVRKTAYRWCAFLNSGLKLDPKEYDSLYLRTYLLTPVKVGITLGGLKDTDKRAALNAAVKLINEGVTHGQSSNIDNWFTFTVTNETKS